MAIRSPLYYNAGHLQEMTTTQVNEIVDQIIYQYSLSPSVVLDVGGSGGKLTGMVDTRLQAGAMSTSTTSFPSEATTAEPSVVSITHEQIGQTTVSVTPTADTGKTFPAYYTSAGAVRAMNLQDMKDTFLHPAIDLMIAGTTTTQQAGTYHISSLSSVSGSTEVSGSNTPVFTNTEADTSQYTAGEIQETLDQPITRNSFFLQRINGNDNSYTLPLFIDGSNDLQTYPEATFESLVSGWIRNTAASSADGFSIRFNTNAGGGNVRGTGMADTRLNGTGDYQQRFVNTDDYRAQEFPNGTATTINTYFLRINKS